MTFLASAPACTSCAHLAVMLKCMQQDWNVASIAALMNRVRSGVLGYTYQSAYHPASECGCKQADTCYAEQLVHARTWRSLAGTAAKPNPPSLQILEQLAARSPGTAAEQEKRFVQVLRQAGLQQAAGAQSKSHAALSGNCCRGWPA